MNSKGAGFDESWCLPFTSIEVESRVYRCSALKLLRLFNLFVKYIQPMDFHLGVDNKKWCMQLHHT